VVVDVYVVVASDPRKTVEWSLTGEAWWILQYSPQDWYERYPNSAYTETSVNREICPDIESLKRGDRITVTVQKETAELCGKVLKVVRGWTWA